MPLATIAGAIATMLLLVCVGIALRVTGALRRDGAGALNSVIVYAALPALIFINVAKAELSWELVRVAGIGWAVMLAGLVVAWEIARRLKLPDRTAGAFVLVAALGNTGYIGYPLVQAILGPASMPSAVFYDIFATAGVALTVGIAIAARYGEHEGPIDQVKELLTFPAVVAMLVALAYRFIPLPAGVSNAVMDWMAMLASMAVPLMMISLGLTLDPSAFRGALLPIGSATAIKLVALPALAVALAALLHDPGSTRVVALQAGMPSMLLTLVIGERFKLDTGLIAAVVLASTVACVVTIPLAQLLIR